MRGRAPLCGCAERRRDGGYMNEPHDPVTIVEFDCAARVEYPGSLIKAGPTCTASFFRRPRPWPT
ncbi:hypothetical protein CSE45_4359 [Citreicella sp. SE45]|nr:hypothetical protein CSE45_4359 [Citreicella sp. SE45]